MNLSLRGIKLRGSLSLISQKLFKLFFSLVWKFFHLVWKFFHHDLAYPHTEANIVWISLSLELFHNLLPIFHLKQRSKRSRVSRRASQPLSPITCSFNFDGTLRIPERKALPFPSIPISEVLLHTHLTDPKDLHVITRLEQKRWQVKAIIVVETALEGPLSKAIIHPRTHVFLAPNRLMPYLSSSLFDKGKEQKVYHKSNPQPFLKHNLLKTTCIWAKELREKNRA